MRYSSAPGVVTVHATGRGNHGIAGLAAMRARRAKRRNGRRGQSNTNSCGPGSTANAAANAITAATARSMRRVLSLCSLTIRCPRESLRTTHCRRAGSGPYPRNGSAPGITASQSYVRDELACKPDSVHPDIRAGDHPSRTVVADGLVRSTRELGRAALERSLSDLAPGGVCRAARVTPDAGGLLHRRFTLAGRRSTRRSAFCGTVPRVTPGGRYPPPCPVESGLSSAEPEGSDAAARPARPPFHSTARAGYSGAPSSTSNAAPMIPASLSRLAGTIGVCRSSSGRNLSAFLLTPPPTTNSSGERTNSRWA
jgi:hypothetical protein